MRFTRYMTLAVLGTMLLAPVSAPAAGNKDMEELQRDVAALEQRVQDLQKALLDPKSGTIPALQTMIQQALDTANRTNTSVNSLNTGMMQTLQTSLKGLSDQLSSVAGLSEKVKGISDDVGNLQGTVGELQKTVNRQGAKLDDILSLMKLLPTQTAAPPGADTPAAAQQPSAQMLFNGGVHDQNGGKPELALDEYTQFLKLYPNDGNAGAAQYHIGEIRYAASKFDEAVKDFDAVIEQYSPDAAPVPAAMYMKGMALKKAKKLPEAAATFRDVIKKFPGTDQAGESATALHSINVPAAPAKKPAH